MKCILSATALGGLGWAPAPPKASADGPQLAEVNVLAYGAAGDGITNDTAAIHAARDAAGVGGKLVIPPGTYLVSGLQANVENQQWVLSDGAVVMMKTGAPNILEVVGDGVTIDGGLFDCSAGTLNDWSQQGICVEADGVSIRNVKIHDSPAHGVYGLNCNRLTVADCRMMESHDNGVFVQNCEADTTKYDIVITGNHVESSVDTAGGLGVLGGATTTTPNMPIQRVTIADNTVMLPIDPTAETGGIGIGKCAEWIISGNYVVGSLLGITCPYPVRATISNNQVRQFSGIGIEIPGDITDCVVSNNVIEAAGVVGTVYGPGGSGIQNSMGTVKDLRIDGNSISGFVGDLGGIAFAAGSQVESATIMNNVIRGNCNKYTGIAFADSARNVAISDNSFEAGRVATSIRGIDFFQNPVSNIVIVGNIFTSISSSGTNYLVGFSRNATASGITVRGNAMKAGTSAAFAALFIGTSATNVEFVGNSVDSGTSTVSNGIELYNAVDGCTVTENQFSNLTEAVVRLMASTAVTMKNIKVCGNSIVNVPNRIVNRNSGGAVVDARVICTDE